MINNLELLKQHWKWYYKHFARDIIKWDSNIQDISNDFENRISDLEDWGWWGWWEDPSEIRISSENTSLYYSHRRDWTSKYTLNWSKKYLDDILTKEIFKTVWSSTKDKTTLFMWKIYLKNCTQDNNVSTKEIFKTVWSSTKDKTTLFMWKLYLKNCIDE